MARVALSAAHCANVAAAGGTPAAPRKIFAWASPSAATVAQLKNDSWKGIFDGVHAQCGVAIRTDDKKVKMVANGTIFATSKPLKAAVQASGGEFHCWTNGVPQVLLEDKSQRADFFASAVAVAHEHGIQGYSMVSMVPLRHPAVDGRSDRLMFVPLSG